MSILTDAAAFATDPELRGPLTAAYVAAAISIMTESADTANHRLRVLLAHQSITNPSGVFERFAWSVSTNPTAVGKWVSGDRDGALSDLPYVLSTVFDAIAGAHLSNPAPDPATV